MPRHPTPSPTTRTLTDSVFSGLAAKAAGRDVLPLHVGDTWREPLAAARAEAQRTEDHPHLHGYAPVQGHPALLDAIEAHLEGAVPRDRIQVMSGATAGLSVVCGALLDPGDEVLLPAPYWPLIRGIIAARGAEAVELPIFDRLGDPGFDLEAVLEAAVTERTAAVYVNTPNNPTGRALSRAHLDAVAAVAARHDLWVVSDEAYTDLDYRRDPPPPPWRHPGMADRTVAVHTLSKSHGLAGARVGFAHGPGSAMGAIRGLQTFQTYCAPTPMQLGAAAALEGGAAWVAEARDGYRAAGSRAAEVLGLEAPAGGTFLFFDVAPHLKAGEDVFAFLERCLDAGVLLTPGPASGEAYGTFVRLCFTSVPEDRLEVGLERLAGVLTAPGR